jgi:hypothetical protein
MRGIFPNLATGAPGGLFFSLPPAHPPGVGAPHARRDLTRGDRFAVEACKIQLSFSYVTFS